MLSVLGRYYPIVIPAAVFLLLGLFCFFSAQRALERSPKEPGWVRRHGQRGYPFAREAFPARPADWLGVFGVAVFALVSSMLYTALRSLQDGASWLGGLFSAISLGSILLSVIGAVAMYFLLQRLYGSTLISACGSLLCAASFVGSHSAGACLTLALLLLVLWLNAPQEKLFPAELLYYAACLALCGALALCPALFPSLLLFWALHIYKHVSALRSDRRSPGQFALALAAALLFLLVITFCFALLRMLVVYGFWLGALSEQFARYGFLNAVLRCLKASFLASFVPLARARAIQPMMDAPLLGLGCFGALTAVVMLVRRRDARSKLLLPILAAQLLTWILCDRYVLGVGFTLSASMLFGNYVRGKKKLPVVVLTVLGVLFQLALYVLTCRLPLSESILRRFS